MTVATLVCLDSRPWGWSIVITCPYCGHKHHHGGGSGDMPLLGSRAAHCRRGEYVLAITAVTTVDA